MKSKNYFQRLYRIIEKDKFYYEKHLDNTIRNSLCAYAEQHPDKRYMQWNDKTVPCIFTDNNQTFDKSFITKIYFDDYGNITLFSLDYFGDTDNTHLMNYKADLLNAIINKLD